MKRRFHLWGHRQKSKRGSLYDSMELGSSPSKSKRDLKKDSSRTSVVANETSGDNGDWERIKELSIEQATLKVLKVQKELTKVKKRIQERRVVQQIEIHNLQSRKTKMQHDLKLLMGGSPLNASEYLAVLRDVFNEDPFPSDKKYSDEAVKTLKQEHKCHLLESMAKMVSTQSNEDLMLVMGSIPGLKDEFGDRAKRIQTVTTQVTKENNELKNVLHYKDYILTKMKNKMEIQFSRRTSLSAAMVGLKNLELKTLQELADADSVAGDSVDDSSLGPSIPTPSKWNEYRNKQEISSGLASISDDEPFEEEEEEDEEESQVDSHTSKDYLSVDSKDDSLDDIPQNSEDGTVPLGGNDEKSKKLRQRRKAQLARKQLEEKRKKLNHSTSSHSSFGSETSDSASGDSATENDDRKRRAEAARKRMEAKRRQKRLLKSTSTTSDATPASDVSDELQQLVQNGEGNKKPLESNGEASTERPEKPEKPEKPMMSAAQKARLARQRRAEQLKEKSGKAANKGIESEADGTPQATSLDTSTGQEGVENSHRSVTKSLPMPPPENVLQSPLWSVAKRAKDQERSKSKRNLAIPAIPSLPDSSPNRRRPSPGRRKAPSSRRVAERQKRIEDRRKQNKLGSASDDELESDLKPPSFSQLAKSHAGDKFPKSSTSTMNADTQARIRNGMNKVNTNPPTNSNDDDFAKIAKSHAEVNFPQNTLPSMNADTQARILSSIPTGQPRSGSLPSEKPLVSPAEQIALHAFADEQRRSSMTNVPTGNRVSSAEQRALQAIADAQRKSSMSNPPTEKRMSSAEQRALQAIADAQKGGGSPNPPMEKRVSSAEQRALQAIADAQKGGGSPNPPMEKRVSSAEQRALQAIADAQKGGGSPNPPMVKVISSAEQRALPAIAEKGGGSSNADTQERIRNSANGMDGKRTSSPEKRAGSPSKQRGTRPLPKRQLGSLNNHPGGTLLKASMRDMMTRKQSTRKLESTRKIESDRVKEQRHRAELARQRLEEQRKKLRETRSKRNANKEESSETPSKPAKSSNKDEAGTDNNAPPRSVRRSRTSGSHRQTAIERSRARRARAERPRSADR